MREATLSQKRSVCPASGQQLRCLLVSFGCLQFGHFSSSKSCMRTMLDLVAQIPMHCFDSHNWSISGFDLSAASNAVHATEWNCCEDHLKPPLYEFLWRESLSLNIELIFVHLLVS
jgi:hypothetical protein